MRPSCITEKMMKTIGNAAEPSQTTNSSHLQPMSADGRQKTTQPLPTPWIPQPRQSLLRSFIARRPKHLPPNFAKLRLWAPMGAIKYLAFPQWRQPAPKLLSNLHRLGSGEETAPRRAGFRV